MRQQELVDLVDRLCAEPTEREWLEFKENRFEPQELGEYLSALANSAAWKKRPLAYLLFGVEDRTHQVVGTSFDPYNTKGKGNQDLLIWLNAGLNPKVGFEVETVAHPKGRVVVFSIRPAPGQPVYFRDKAFVRVGSSKTELRHHPAALRSIVLGAQDWSSQICARASIGDLSPEAISLARSQFKDKHPVRSTEIDAWSDQVFLNKAKLTVGGGITHAALLLLGREEASAFLSPAVAKISWILKDKDNRELDYEHFGPPFLLTVDRVLKKIRNLTLRVMPTGTLFPKEISQYDPWVLREALHNCIAHQDYGLRGRINVVETPGSVLFTNRGDFLPGTVETVIRQDAPQETYRNPFLAEAMVQLNMIDTQGGGIKRMFVLQAERFFPLPDYDLTDPGRVAVTIRGTILDESYCRLLMARTDLDLNEIILLDKVQKKVRISKEDHQRLKRKGLVEGRYPNLFVAGQVAKVTGQASRHIKARGLDQEFYRELLVELIREHGPVGRPEIDSLLLDKLPGVLTPKQKKTKIHNLLQELKRAGRIRNAGGRGPSSRWILARGEFDKPEANDGG